MAEAHSGSIKKNSIPLIDAIDMVLDSFEIREKGKLPAVYYLAGDPGIGKTRMMEWRCALNNIAFLPYSPALERVEKFGGIPDTYWIQNGENQELHCKWSMPIMIKEINDAAAQNKRVLVLFDDWHLCDETLQAIGFELFTYYSLNNFKVPNNVVFCLAGNTSSAAGARTQLSAIRNRCTVLHTRPDINQWIRDFAEVNGLPDVAISFFSNETNKIYFTTEEQTTDQFASPRSWSNFFDQMEIYEKKWKAHPQFHTYLQAALEGNVGPAAATQFYTFYRFYMAVNPEQYYNSGRISKENIKGENIEKYAFCSSMINCFNDMMIKAYSKRKNREITEKQFNEDRKKYCNVFVNMLKIYEDTHVSELFFKSAIRLFKMPADPESGFPGGVELTKDLVKEQMIAADIVQKIRSQSDLLVSYDAKKKSYS